MRPVEIDDKPLIGATRINQAEEVGHKLFSISRKAKFDNIL